MLRNSRLPFSVLAIVAALGAPASVTAQTDAAGAAAVARFQQGKKLFEAGNFAEACPQFEQAVGLKRAAGGLMWLGECYLELKRPASAHTALLEAEAIARTHGDQEKLDYIATLKKRIGDPANLPQLQLVVAETAQVEGLKLTLDGQAFGSEGWNLPFPADPGKKVIEISAPGYESQRLEVTVATSGTASLTVPALERVAVAPAPHEESASSSPAEPAEKDDLGQESGMSTQALVGWIAGGVGLLTAGAGTFLYFQGQDRIDKWCEEDNNEGKCDLDDSEAYDSIHRGQFNTGVAEKNMGRVGWIAGGVLLVGGLVLIVTDPAADAPRTSSAFTIIPAVSARGGGLFATGRF